MTRQLWQGPNNKKKMLLIVSIAVLCLVIILAVQYMKKNSAGKTVTTNRSQTTTVDVIAVPRTGLVKRISLTGQTVPKAQVDVAAKYQGRVAVVYGDLGQSVAAGQVLVVQDTGDADIFIAQNRAAYQQAAADAKTNEVTYQANYDKARADYQRALADYQRQQSLFTQGAISREALDASQQSLADARAAVDVLANQVNSSAVPATIESARAAAAKAQQSISAGEKQRDDLILRAPFAGVVSYRQVEAGAIVQPGQKLLSIVDNSSIYVDCQVSEQDLAALTTGMDIDVQIESLGQTFPGKIIYVSPANDVQNQSFSLRIALNDFNPAIRSGMFARVNLNTVLRPNVLVVPKDAVLDKNGQSYVFVINTNNAAEQRAVQVGARGDQTVEILNGINEGEQVAVSNLARLRDGMVVVPNAVTLDSRGDSQ